MVGLVGWSEDRQMVAGRVVATCIEMFHRRKLGRQWIVLIIDYSLNLECLVACHRPQPSHRGWQASEIRGGPRGDRGKHNEDGRIGALEGKGKGRGPKWGLRVLLQASEVGDLNGV